MASFERIGRVIGMEFYLTRPQHPFRKWNRYRYAGQHQQRLAPAGGGILKQHWQARGTNLPSVSVKMPDGTIEQSKSVNLSSRFDMRLQSWNMSFKDSSKSDYVVG